MGIWHSREHQAGMIALVCQSMREGLTARKSCEMHGVEFATMRLWCSKDAEFEAQYVAAREMLFEHWEEDIINISDDQHEGVIRRTKLMGTEIETRDMIDHRRLRIESRKWLLARRKPRIFGDKMALGGADDLPPIRSKADVTLSPEDAYKELLGGRS